MPNKKKTFLLTIAPPWGVDMPPLGLAYLSSFLEKRNIPHDVLDLNAILYQNTGQDKQALWQMENIRCWVEKEFFIPWFESQQQKLTPHLSEMAKYDGVCFSVNRSNLLFSIELAKRLRKKNEAIKIIFGGPSCFVLNQETNIPKEFYNPTTKKLDFKKGLIDFFVLREGEFALTEIIDALDQPSNKPQFKHIAGITFFDTYTDTYQAGTTISQIKNLDELPHPTFKKFDLSLYTEQKLPIILSKGCVNNCHFCNDHILYPKYKHRSPENVIKEIIYHIKENNISFFHSCDLLINGHLKQLELFCDLLIKHKLNITWTGQAIARKEMTASLYQKLKKSGCASLVLGVESFSDKVLKRMNKNITLADIENNIKALYHAGMEVVLNLIVGFPGETEQDIDITIEALKRNQSYIKAISSLSLLMATRESMIDKDPKKFGITLSPSTDMALWVGNDNSTYLSRKKRALKIIDILKKLNIPVLSTTFYDENWDKQKKQPLQDKAIDITLCLCPPWGTMMPPIGIGFLAQNLQQQDIHVRAIDFNIALFHKASSPQKHFWNFNSFNHWIENDSFAKIKDTFSDDIDNFVKTILETKSPIIGFSVFSPNRLFSIEAIRRIKAKDPNKIILVGGRGCMTEGDRALFYPAPLVDLFIIGEGEQALIKTISHLKQNKPLKTLSGIEEINGQYLLKEPIIENLSKLPFPNYDQFDLSTYTEPILPLLFSRGCVGSCSFCSDFLGMGKFRSRSANEMFSEIHYHYYNNKISHFWFNDPAINGDPTALETLCDLIIESGIKIKFNALAIPKKDLHLDLLTKLKKAGCYSLNFGLEAGSDSLLKKMNKHLFTTADVTTVLKNAKKIGLENRINFLVGFPGETEKEVDETLQFLEKNKSNIYGVNNVNLCVALTDSLLYKNPKKFNISFPKESPDKYWKDSTGNTYQVRVNRLNKIKNKLAQLQIPYEISNTEENEANIAMLSQKDTPLDILLIIAPPWGVDMPPLGIAYLCTYLKSKNIHAHALDLNVEIYRQIDKKRQDLWGMENIRCWQEDDFFSTLLSQFEPELNKSTEKILSHNAPFVGFSVNQSNMRFSLELAKRIKQKDPNKIIIFGGPETFWDARNENFPAGLYNHITNELMIELGIIDIFVKGEGEETLHEIIESYKQNKSVQHIKGITYFSKGKYIKTEPRPPIKNLDTLPYPTFEEFNLSNYLERKIPILSSRGCINQCKFCNDHYITKKYRYRSAEHIFSEMKYHMENKGIGYLHFCDLLINGNLKELEKLCDLIIASPYTFGWSGQAFVRDDMTREQLHKLKQAGCSALVLGVESCSDHVLKCMNKRYTKTKIKNVLQKAKDSGLDTVINLIVGFPGESEKEFHETMQFIEDNVALIDKISSVQTLHLTTGSDIDIYPQNFGIIRPKKESWFRWYTKENNTYEIRKHRLKIMYSLLQKLKIPVFSINLYEDTIAQQREAFALSEKEIEEKENTIDTETAFDTEEKKLLPKVEPITYIETIKDYPVDIILVNCPPWGTNNPPIGMAYLSTYLAKHKVRSQIFDFNISLFLESRIKYSNLWHVENKNFWSNEQTFKQLKDIFNEQIEEATAELIASPVEIIGFSVVDPKERITIEFIKRIKQKAPYKKIILGGPACSTEESRKIFMDLAGKYIDVFVIGEGEETLREAVVRIKENKSLANLEGALTKEHNKWSYQPRKPIRPLDNIPYPTYQDFNLDAYGKSSLLLEWSRGCAGSCSFCKNHTLVPGYRIHSATHLVSELKYHATINQIYQFTICDSLMNGNLDVLEEALDLIIHENLDIDISGQVAPKAAMSGTLFKKLKKAGFNRMQFGLESGSNKVLKLMQKKYSVEDVAITLKRAKQAGIETEIFIIIGFPGETENDFYQTVDFIQNNRENIDTIKSINTLHLISGTDVYDNQAKHHITLPQTNWHYLWESTDKTNTYTIRRKRGEILFDLSLSLGINVKETNLSEGKESTLSQEAKTDAFLSHINSLQELGKQTVPFTKEDEQLLIATRDEKKAILLGLETEITNIKNSKSIALLRTLTIFSLSKKIKTIRILSRLPRLIVIFCFSLFMESYLYLLRKYKHLVIFPDATCYKNTKGTNHPERIADMFQNKNTEKILSPLDTLKNEVNDLSLKIKKTTIQLTRIRESKSFKLAKQLIHFKNGLFKLIRYLKRMPRLLFLLLFALVMEGYLYLLRKYRGSIIFPGG